jgi:hypothetical protein
MADLIQRQSVALLGLIYPQSLDRLTHDMPRVISGAWAYVFPGFGPTATGLPTVAVDAVLVAGFPWLSARLRALSDRAETRVVVQFARTVLPFIVLYSAILMVGEVWYAIVVEPNAVGRYGALIEHYRGAQIILGMISSALDSLVLLPILLGGLSGSLRRMLMKAKVDMDTFLLDGLSSWKSLAGIFLILYVLRYSDQLSLQLIPMHYLGEPVEQSARYGPMLILLEPWRVTVQFVIRALPALFAILSPYEATCAHLGTFAALSAAFRKLLANVVGVARFIAFGITVVTVLRVFGQVIYPTAVYHPLTGMPLLVFTCVYYTFLPLFISAAVWFLYVRISGGCDERADDA